VPFKAWLYRMAHNLMVDHHRTRHPTTDLDGIDVPDQPETEPSEAERRVLVQEVHAHLRAGLERLSEDHHQVIVLRFLLEQSAREVGEIMQRKEVTIRGLQMRALQALRREIELTSDLP
jgi:RNA polymerase sigma-70 factor (ECF subfamily)